MVNIAIGTALRTAHGGLAEYLGPEEYLGSPGAILRVGRWDGRKVVPASEIDTDEYRPIPGRVVSVVWPTGRWSSPHQECLGLDLPGGNPVGMRVRRGDMYGTVLLMVEADAIIRWDDMTESKVAADQIPRKDAT